MQPPGNRPPPPPEQASAEDAAVQKVKLIRNDYNQHFVDSGDLPANSVRESDPLCRFNQYPRWAKLIQAKETVHLARVHPAQKLKCDLKTFDLGSLGSQFDVVLIDPPWEEYVRRTPDVADDSKQWWTLEDLKALRVDLLADNPSFVFIWAGDTHLDDARTLLNHWGYRRCEDITWLKTLPTRGRAGALSGDSRIMQVACQEGPLDPDMDLKSKLERVTEWRRHGDSPYLGLQEEGAVLQRVKEHCLMGLKGLVRRSLDGHFVHANIDTDVIIADAQQGRDSDGLLSTTKPIELYEIIERFCLGRRKIELFGTNRNERAGWLTLGLDIEQTTFHPKEYLSWFRNRSETSAWDGQQPPEAGAPGGGAPGIPRPPGQYNNPYGGNSQTLNPPPPQNPPSFKAGTGGLPSEQSTAREENPLASRNAFPNLTDYHGGRYEGTSQILEFLRPKSPPNKPVAPAAQNSPGSMHRQ